MCGRYASTRSATDLAALFDADDDTGDDRLPPDYNIAPTDPVHVVRVSSTRGRVVSVARWGLVPFGDGPPSGKMINARVETVADSRAFSLAYRRRRCLVPADGWYEWLRDGAEPPTGSLRRPPRGRKQPYFMTPRDGGLLAFAGLWARRGDLVTCTVLTAPAAGELARVHDRMPLVLPPTRWPDWLSGTGDLTPAPADYLESLELRPVGPAVGDVRNDGPALIEALPAVEPVDLTLF